MAIEAQLYFENHGFPLDNGCGFNEFGLNLQQEQQQQMQHKINQFNQNMCFDHNDFEAVKNKNCDSSMAFSQCLAVQLEKQRLEIDQYVRFQNERLRFILQEQNRQQIMNLLKKTEFQARILFAQKEEQITEATKRSMELEDLVRKMELETQVWQRTAQENQAMAISLHNVLEQLNDSVCCSSNNNNVEDAESYCNDNRAEPRSMKKTTMGVCKCCNVETVCVLFLPCRHLSSCKACETYLNTCPVCKSVKKGSVEVLI